MHFWEGLSTLHVLCLNSHPSLGAELVAQVWLPSEDKPVLAVHVSRFLVSQFFFESLPCLVFAKLQVLFHLCVLTSVLGLWHDTKLVHEKVGFVIFDGPVNKFFSDLFNLFRVLLMLRPLFENLLNEAGEEDNDFVSWTLRFVGVEHDLRPELFNRLIDNVLTISLESWGSSSTVCGFKWQNWDATANLS